MIVNNKFTIVPFSSSLQEEIFTILSNGPINGNDLLNTIASKYPTTKQGVYKALRKLLDDEIIIKNEKFFSLNTVWLSRFSDFIEKSEINLGAILPFSDNSPYQRKVINFKNTEALDIYWGHLFLTITRIFKSEPIFFYNHHSWFIHERPHSEKYLYNISLKKSQKILITIGVKTTIAQKFKEDFTKNNIQIAIDETFPILKSDHLCIVGDYFIITRYSSETSSKINSLFKKATAFGETETKELHKILLNCKKPKIIITKNYSKANVWKHKLAKNFVIKKSEL
ncbi:MAG: hypothetical protein ACOYMB_04265 [Patescibacteria group bacterium]